MKEENTTDVRKILDSQDWTRLAEAFKKSEIQWNAREWEEQFKRWYTAGYREALEDLRKITLGKTRSSKYKESESIVESQINLLLNQCKEEK